MEGLNFTVDMPGTLLLGVVLTFVILGLLIFVLTKISRIENKIDSLREVLDELNARFKK